MLGSIIRLAKDWQKNVFFRQSKAEHVLRIKCNDFFTYPTTGRNENTFVNQAASADIWFVKSSTPIKIRRAPATLSTHIRYFPALRIALITSFTAKAATRKGIQSPRE